MGCRTALVGERCRGNSSDTISLCHEVNMNTNAKSWVRACWRPFNRILGTVMIGSVIISTPVFADNLPTISRR